MIILNAKEKPKHKFFLTALQQRRIIPVIYGTSNAFLKTTLEDAAGQCYNDLRAAPSRRFAIAKGVKTTPIPHSSLNDHPKAIKEGSLAFGRKKKVKLKYD